MRMAFLRVNVKRFSGGKHCYCGLDENEMEIV